MFVVLKHHCDPYINILVITETPEDSEHSHDAQTLEMLLLLYDAWNTARSSDAHKCVCTAQKCFLAR